MLSVFHKQPLMTFVFFSGNGFLQSKVFSAIGTKLSCNDLRNFTMRPPYCLGFSMHQISIDVLNSFDACKASTNSLENSK